MTRFHINAACLALTGLITSRLQSILATHRPPPASPRLEPGTLTTLRGRFCLNSPRPEASSLADGTFDNGKTGDRPGERPGVEPPQGQSTFILPSGIGCFQRSLLIRLMEDTREASRLGSPATSIITDDVSVRKGRGPPRDRTAPLTKSHLHLTQRKKPACRDMPPCPDFCHRTPALISPRGPVSAGWLDLVMSDILVARGVFLLTLPRWAGNWEVMGVKG